MTKKIFLCVAFALVFASCAFGLDSESFDVAGRWLIKGVGHVDKSFVRSQLELNGYMNFHTSASEDINMLESLDAYIRIDATGLNIKVYDEYLNDKFDPSIPVPARIPTASYPIELPTIKYDDLTYEATITGSNSGTITVYGVVKDIDVIGDVEIDTDCKIWREGTPEPEIDSGKSSGCNSGFGVIAFMFVLGVLKLVRD